MKLQWGGYDGTYPNLCSGKLYLMLDDKRIDFPDFCLRSGGGITNDYSDVIEGGWTITDWPLNFPEELKDLAGILVNENIPRGCCGGCI
jgi:hypothetical protein